MMKEESSFFLYINTRRRAFDKVWEGIMNYADIDVKTMEHYIANCI